MGPLTIWLILQAMWAIIYNKFVADPIKGDGTLDERMENAKLDDMEGQADFNNSFFSCFSDKWVFLQGLCCPMVRMAHTNSVSGVCAFWETLWCYCCCSWLTIGIGPCCLVMWWRLRLKNIMKVEENYFYDFCGTMICPMISICQMSTAVDSAMGYQVTGCCEYTPYYNNDMN
jgi:Cys-rich protein (TIGR01571 family)